MTQKPIQTFKRTVKVLFVLSVKNSMLNDESEDNGKTETKNLIYKN